METKLRGKLSKKVFDYLSMRGVDISTLSCREIVFVGDAVGVKSSYVRKLKSRYRGDGK